MMSAKMGTVNDEDMIRMAFRVLDKDGSGTIKSSAFKHLMTHIGKECFQDNLTFDLFVKFIKYFFFSPMLLFQ